MNLKQKFNTAIKDYGSTFTINTVEAKTGYDGMLDSPTSGSATVTYKTNVIDGVLAYEGKFYFSNALGAYEERREVRLYSLSKNSDILKNLSKKGGYVELFGLRYAPRVNSYGVYSFKGKVVVSYIDLTKKED